MNVELGNLPVGKWRYLTLPEIEKMNELVADSEKTDSASKTKGMAEERAAVQYIPKKKGGASKESAPEKSHIPERAKPKKNTFKDYRNKKGKGSKGV